jgi:carboxyl-terminal processing protease
MQLSSKKLTQLSSILLGGIVACTSAFPLTATAVPLKLKAISTAKLDDNPKAVVDEAWQVVNREYVDGTFNKTNWLQVRKDLLSRTYTNRLEAYNAIRIALRQLNDPYTRFMSPTQYQALTSQTNGEMVGIGLRLEETGGQASTAKQLVVADTADNSPAAQAGIKAGDKLLSINGSSTATISAIEAVKLIRGEVGKSVKLKLSRSGKGTFEVSLALAPIEVSSVSYHAKQENKVKVGYIRLTEFSANSTKQMEGAVKALNREQVNAFVVDMRGNPGGLLQNSIEIVRIFLNSGVIVKTIDRKGSNEQFRANQTALTTLPVAVLVDGNSASASEIFAGALKDNARATIVGSATFGKALVQSVHGLQDGSGLAVTVAHYYTPNGTDIGHKGVTPNLKVDLSASEQQNITDTPDLVASSQDVSYQAAINSFQNLALAKPPNDGKALSPQSQGYQP